MPRRTVVAIALTALAVQLSACQLMTGPNPGAGLRDRQTQRRAQPIIAALERFCHDRGYYPTKIQELVPRYIADQTALGAGSFTYTARGKGYRLGYAYVAGIRPLHGVNQCEYDSTKKKWECSGYM
jgi:hypothetical protein